LQLGTLTVNRLAQAVVFFWSAAALRLAFSNALTCAAVGFAVLRIWSASAAVSALAFFSAVPVTASCPLTARNPQFAGTVHSVP
jgi:hypothetical protein